MKQCPICGEHHSYLVNRFDKELDQPLVDILSEETPGWKSSQGACTRCLDQAHLQLQLQYLKGRGEPGEVNGYKILPTPLRLMTEETLSGKGVTICMIDSGFYLHPDLIYPKNRILKVFDITDPGRDKNYFGTPQGNAWHGTMTSVVCAGNGHLSGGLYRGIAHEANVVLLKVTDARGAITSENIAKAIEWAITNAHQYHIRIINLSVTDDEQTSYKENIVDQAVARAVDKGIVVVAAAGNDPYAPLKAPANAPHAITVGGLNDQNTLDPLTNTLYHSTYGKTIDQLQKPDIIAPAIWLPAPILPGTKEQREAATLFDLAHVSDKSLRPVLTNVIGLTQLDKRLVNADNGEIRKAVHDRIGMAKYISGHYQHADGTSFAAPIVCSVIAQMIEANPGLDPVTIREILLVTAKQLPAQHRDRQGWGLIQPAHAVEMASGRRLSVLPGITPVIDYERMMINFYLHRKDAESVSLTGDFLQWSHQGLALHKNGTPDEWKASFPFRGKGVYRYKFLIDNQTWLSDPRNFFREPDGFNDFNSKLIIL